jgi:hypothetical protein
VEETELQIPGGHGISKGGHSVDGQGGSSRVRGITKTKARNIRGCPDGHDGKTKRKSRKKETLHGGHWVKL